MNWIWDALRGVYTKLLRSIGRGETIALRDEFTAQAMLESDALATRLLIDGDITIQQYVLDMRSLIRDVYRAQYELAIGGVNNMSQADFGRLGGLLNEQYRYLQNFANELASGQMSPLKAMSRARMYVDGSTQAFERARAADFGLVLPQYPGDGGTVCRSNCKCHWEIRETRDEWRCYWVLGAAEHCDDCLRNSQVWSPLVISKVFGFTASADKLPQERPLAALNLRAKL